MSAGDVDAREAYHRFAVELAQHAAGVIAAARPSAAHAATKVDASDWVTPFDRAVEIDIRDRIAARYPSHVIVGEEFGRTDAAGEDTLAWHLDPIDGTLNFVHGVPWVSFSLALADRDGVLVGVVADVHRGEVYSAIRDRGAFIDDARVTCATAERMEGGVFLTEWSRQSPWPGMYRYLDRIAAVPAGTRIMGSCALALALVGVGRATGTVLAGHYNSWDVYAGALIAREGGASIFSARGPDDGVPMDGVLAAPPAIAPMLWRAWTGEGT
ncbi:MAG TPA: inositol monophosphatase family protein [Casimicrobiaceae bacterium]|nr:inositol monophosphatase family protein [Casimicrobiaceae bacterium]